MSGETTADVVLEFAEDHLASLALYAEEGVSDRLVPFYLAPDQLETVALERRFVLGLVDGPHVVDSCHERIVVELTIQYVVGRESRRRMVRDLAQIWRALRKLSTSFASAGHGNGLKPPTIQSPYQFDYTSVLGFVFVTITVAFDYHVVAPA